MTEIVGNGAVPHLFITRDPDRLATGTRTGTAHLVKKPYSADRIRTVSSQVPFDWGSQMVGDLGIAAA